MGWVRNLSTSTLAFDISQFFSLLNHCLLTLIFEKVGFDLRVIKFFSNYLVGRKTQYFWNSFSSLFFNVDVRVGQGLALSPILSTLYLVPFLHILENCLKNLKIPVFILFFVDDGLLVTQSKSFSFSNSLLFHSYNVVSNLLSKFGLIVEHLKTEVFYFSRLHSPFNSPPLDLSSIGGPVLYPKEFWKYLGFIFDRKLSFHQHIDFYSNKMISTVKYMKILGNSVRGLIPHQKCLLYRSCILPIALYSFQLWYYNRTPLSYLLKMLGKIQRRAAIWILGAFKTFPLFSLKAIAELIPINLHLQKLSRRSQLRAHTLPNNHILQSLMEPKTNVLFKPYSLSLGFLSKCQCELIKGPVVDMDNHFNEVFPSFDPLNPEFASGCGIIDTLSSHFSFHSFSKHNEDNLKSRVQQLDYMAIKSSSNPSYALIIMNSSIKNNIATSISHVHIHNKPITKTLYHVVNVISTEAELFVIRYSIN